MSYVIDSEAVILDPTHGRTVLLYTGKHGHCAFYAGKNSERRVSRFYSSACEAITVSHAKGMSVVVQYDVILPPTD